MGVAPAALVHLDRNVFQEEKVALVDTATSYYVVVLLKVHHPSANLMKGGKMFLVLVHTFFVVRWGKLRIYFMYIYTEVKFKLPTCDN